MRSALLYAASGPAWPRLLRLTRRTRLGFPAAGFFPDSFNSSFTAKKPPPPPPPPPPCAASESAPALAAAAKAAVALAAEAAAAADAADAAQNRERINRQHQVGHRIHLGRELLVGLVES